jgi:hypothetical protein
MKKFAAACQGISRKCLPALDARWNRFYEKIMLKQGDAIMIDLVRSDRDRAGWPMQQNCAFRGF